MKQHRKLQMLVGCLLLLINVATAKGDTGHLALGGKIGTLGVGAEMTYGLLPHVNARIGINAFSYTFDQKIDSIDYEFDFNLLSGSFMADWHFLQSAFRLTAGVVINGNNIDLQARTEDSLFIIDDVAYSREDVGELDGTIDFNLLSPYLGIGWGNAVGETRRVSFFVDLGVLFQGAPQADLSATGRIASDPDFRRHLRNEEAEIEDETNNFRVYPVFSIGVTYQF